MLPLQKDPQQLLVRAYNVRGLESGSLRSRTIPAGEMPFDPRCRRRGDRGSRPRRHGRRRQSECLVESLTSMAAAADARSHLLDAGAAHPRPSDVGSDLVAPDRDGVFSLCVRGVCREFSERRRVPPPGRSKRGEPAESLSEMRVAAVLA